MKHEIHHHHHFPDIYKMACLANPWTIFFDALLRQSAALAEVERAPRCDAEDENDKH